MRDAGKLSSSGPGQVKVRVRSESGLEHWLIIILGQDKSDGLGWFQFKFKGEYNSES